MGRPDSAETYHNVFGGRHRERGSADNDWCNAICFLFPLYYMNQTRQNPYHIMFIQFGGIRAKATHLLDTDRTESARLSLTLW
jgi:hypothetical protein